MNVWGKHEIQSIRDIDITNKVVILDHALLKDEFKDKSFQALLAWGGFGCQPFTSGNAVFVYSLVDGESFRVERYELIGMISDDMLEPAQKIMLQKIVLEEVRRKRDGKL